MTDLLKELEAVVAKLRRVPANFAEGSAWGDENRFAAHALLLAHHAEITEAVKDARRYRALKELTLEDWTVAKDSVLGGLFQYIGDDLDAAIDAHNSALEAGE